MPSFIRIALIFLFWRGALLALAAFGLALSGEYAGSYAHDWAWRYLPGHEVLNGLVRWDADWYEFIARQGYSTEGYRVRAVAFFPLYPYLARFLGNWVGNPIYAGLILSNGACLFALWVLFKLWSRAAGAVEAQRAILLLLVFPGSFFLSAFYTEGLFLLLVAGAFYFFLAERYLLVGLLGMLASLTRPTGVLLFGVFGAALAWHGWRGQRLPRAAMAICLIPLGLGLYALLLYSEGQHPLAFLSAQSYWGREAALPFTTLFITLTRVDWSFPRDMIGMQFLANALCAIWFLCLGLVGLVRGLRARTGLELAQPLYVLAGVLVPLGSGSADSMLRYCAVLFPVFAMMAAGLKNSLAFYWVLYVFSILLTIYTLGFMNKFWVV